MIKKYWLWVWVSRSKVRSGYDFNTKEEAELYFYRHFKDEGVKHEVTYE